MTVALDISGRRFGRLIAVRPDGRKRYGKAWHVTWLCRCDCGSTKTLTCSRLTTGNTKSCGCLNRERQAVFGDIAPKRPKTRSGALNNILSTYRGHARARGLPWSLATADAQSLMELPCEYCGVPPTQVHCRAPEFTYNGIDRVDSSKGYEPGNVVPCCGTCNKAKNAMTLAEFRAWIDKVHAHMSRT